MKKVLILTASYGSWHNTAANNLAEFYKRKWWETKIIDLITFINPIVAKLTQKSYKIMSEDIPILWEKFFNLTDKVFLAKIIYSLKDPFTQNKFNKLVEKFDPNVVISVYPFWNLVVKGYKTTNKSSKRRYWIVITDAINIQSFWYIDENIVDKYFVIDDLTKNIVVRKFKISSDKVVVSFFPILPEIFVDKRNIDKNKIMILLTSLKKDFVFWMLEYFKDKEVEVKIVKWRNDKLYEEVEQSRGDVEKFAFYDFLDIKKELKNNWIMIAKAWWALTSECIATDTPMIVPYYIGWQEEWNVKFLYHYSLGFSDNNVERVKFIYKYLDWDKILPNFKKVKKKNSCEIIYESLI